MKKTKDYVESYTIHGTPVFTRECKPGMISFQTEDPVLDRPTGKDDAYDWILVPLDQEGNRILKNLVQMPPIREKIAMQFVEHLLGCCHATVFYYSELYEMGIFNNREVDEG